MIDILKKQWFVVMIALILIIFGVYVIYDTNRGKLPGKKVDGNALVASLEGANFTANDLYDKIDEVKGDELLATLFQQAVILEYVETTDDLKSEAKLQADQITASMQQQDATNYRKNIATSLQNMGFDGDDLEGFTMLTVKNNKLLTDYFDANLDTLFTPIHASKKSRLVSHILVKMEDSANPTEEELAKVKQVEDALAAGDAFADVAKQYSDDTGSGAEGGSVGYVDSDNSGSLVTPFHKQAMALSKGETSEWVKVSSTDSKDSYSGWHLIQVTETDKDAIVADENAKDSIYTAISNANKNIGYKVVWEASKTLNVEFPDEEVKTRIMNYLGVKE